MSKRKKISLVILTAFTLIITSILFAAPRFAQNYIEENSHELLGRKITVEKIRINYFTLTLDITKFTLFEANDKDVFVSFDQFMVNIQLIPCLRQEYTISAFLLDNFYVNIETDGEQFNFDDLIPEPDTTDVVEIVDTTTSQDIRFSLNNVIFSRGGIAYNNYKDEITHELSNINFELPAFSWNNEESKAGLKFKFEPQGELKLQADINQAKERFYITTIIRSLALDQFSPEVKALLATTGIEGTLNNTIHINGSMVNPDDIIVSGEIELSHFILNDAAGKPILENELLGIYIDSIDLLNGYYGIEKLLISEPKIYAQLYSEETNFDQLMQPMTEATLQDSVDNSTSEEDTTSNDETMYFQVDSFVLNQGEIHLIDHTLNRPFNYHITAMNTQVTSISSDAKEVPIDFSLMMNDHGIIKGDAQISMINSNEVEYTADLEGLNLKSFSPYSEYYIARPVKRGHMNFEGNATMTETVFNANNKIRINDLEMGYKTEDKAQVKVPINLALSILKDKNGDIKIDLPLEGNPSDPEFNMGKLIVSTLTDFLVKVASAPFAMVADIAGVDPERIKQIHLTPGKAKFPEDELKTLEQIAIALREKPEMTFIFTQEIPVIAEQQAIALLQVKQNFISSKNETKDSTEIALLVEELNKKDDKFIEYIQQKDGISDTLSIEEQCISIIGKENLDLALIQLSEDRDQNLKKQLITQLNVDPNSVIIRQADTENRNLKTTEPIYSVEISIK